MLVRERHPYGYPGEVVFDKNLPRVEHSLKEVFTADVVHYHDEVFLRRSSRRRTYFLEKLDYHVARSLMKNIVFHFHGTAIRDPLQRTRNAAYFREKLVVATPDLLPFVPPNATWIPGPVDTEIFYPNRVIRDDKVRIGYYDPPYDWGLLVNTPEKTRRVIRSLGREKILESPAYRLNWSDMPHYYNGVDIWIDKMNLDFYGLSACEAAACGIPVIAHIGENERGLVPECPFLQSSYSGLSEAIEYFMEENTRRYMGQKCFDFVKKVHEASRICEMTSKVYQSN